MKVGIRFKFLSVSVLVIVTALTLSDLIFVRALRERTLTSTKMELVKLVRALSLLVPSTLDLNHPESADVWADDIGRASGARVTLIRADGIVIGDSSVAEKDLQQLENHRDRPEVQQAMRAGEGQSARFSVTTGVEMLYAANAFSIEGQRLVLRFSRPLATVDNTVASMRLLLLGAGLLGLALAVGTSFVTSHLFLKKLRTLVETARSLADGKHPAHVEMRTQDELGGLAGSLNRLADQVEAQLGAFAEERDRLEIVLDGMTEAVIALDTEHRITLINRAAVVLLGLSKEPVGHALIETIRAPELKRLVTAESSGSASTAEFDLPDGSGRRLLARASGQRRGGHVLVLLDVTELRRLEAVRRDFVANVSHELRTPVTVIRANAETLLSGALEDPEAAEKFTKAIMSSAERLGQLIGDLLDLSRIEAGKYNLDLRPIDVASAFERVVSSLGARSASKRITVRCTPNAEEISTLADSRALDQVLLNLLDNAIKYTDDGGYVVLRGFSRDGKVRIEIEDNGPGVAAAHRPRLFERFYRVDTGRSREMGGTGLGLAIVKHLVNAMAGEVGMTSATPRGSIFWVVLPASMPVSR